MVLSNKILNYNFTLKFFVAYIVANYIRLRVPVETKDAIAALYPVEWTNVFDPYTDPNSNRTIVANNMNALYVTDYAITEATRSAIAKNPLITLTGTDRANLGIPVPVKRRANIPALTYSPSIALISNTYLLPVIFAFDPHFPTKKRKPKDAAYIGLKIAYTVDATPPKPEDYRAQPVEGSTEIELPQTVDKLNLRLWIIAYYVSPTGEQGPDSEPFSVVIV
jgi:hypothetical protein